RTAQAALEHRLSTCSRGARLSTLLRNVLKKFQRKSILAIKKVRLCSNSWLISTTPLLRSDFKISVFWSILTREGRIMINLFNYLKKF
ncbi:hypothetical protein BpHYR1_047905, partial [Brachionus plicatilis]